MYKGFSFVLIVFVVFGLLIGAFFLANFLKKDNNVSPPKPESTENILDKTAPSPFPFMEITIPSLRNREYKSNLSDLKQVSTNTNYTSYFASYDSDGLKLNGLLTKPSGEMPAGGWPAIVFVHGYIPPTQYQTLVNYNSYVDYFAKNGFVVFKIDLRGHADSEGEASGAYYSGDYIVDTLNARAALLGSGFVKENGAGLWGHSMAGNVVFRTLAAREEIPAVVIWAGAVYTYTDWEFGINDNSYRPPDDNSERAKKRRELFEKYGEFAEDSDFWRQVPATNYLDGINSAIQVHHAVNDNVVTIDYSRNLMKILDGTSIAHELFEYADGGHNLTGGTFNTAMTRSVQFFKENL